MNLCRFSSYISLTALLLSGAAQADTRPLDGRVEINHRYSNDRAITMSEFWVPLAQNEADGSVLFGDLRMMGDNNDNKEFNIGVGYRKIVQTKLLGDGIAGGMIWFDRRFTKRGSKFNQITGGLEWLGEQYDIRFNGYVPLNTSKTHTQTNTSNSALGFVGNQILVNTDQSVLEEALPGVDVEVGYKLPFLDGVTDVTRVYAGGYHFEGDKADDVTGYRARIASDITSDVQLGARYQRDDVRGSQTYLEATIRFPFNSKKSFKRDGFRSRLDESPERDIDIVSNEAVTDDGANQLVLNATTGATQNVIHVDNTAGGGGDGSIEAPYNTLAAAEAAAVANDLIYVHRGDGTTAGQDAGITIDDEGQMLVGSGVDLRFSSGRFTTGNGQHVSDDIVVQTATTAPVITNGTGNGVDVTADNVFVTGITVDGASANGISSDDVNNFIVDSVTTNNNTLVGIRSGYSAVGNYNVSIKNNVTINNNDGVRLVSSGNSNLQISLTNNILNSNFSNGFSFVSTGTGNNFINIQDNQFNDNSGTGNSSGILINESGFGTTSSVIKNNVINGNEDFGVYILTNTNSGTNITTIEDNIINNNDRFGILAQVFSGTGSISANIKSNIFDANRRNFQLRALQSGLANAEISRNIFSNSNSSNVSFNAENNGQVIASLSQNIIVNNNETGVRILDNSTASLNIDLGGGSLGSIGHNSIFNNTLEEIRVDLDGDELSAENNYWGTAAGLLPAEVLLEDGSTIDASPFLTSDPNQ